MKKLTLFLANVIACAALSAADAPTGIRMDCNGDLNITGTGKTVSAKTVSPRFEENTALVFGPKNRVLLPQCGMLKSSAGTLEMRIKSINWNGNDNTFKYFFYARKNGGSDVIFLRKTHKSALEFAIGKLPHDLIVLQCSIADWEPNQYHTVKVSWGNDKLVLYVDGKAVAERKYQDKNLVWSDPLWIGGSIWGTSHGETALDYFRLAPQAEF